MEKKLASTKKHVCQECGSSFNRPYRLTQHLLLHQNIKSFVCGEKDCKKSYMSKSHLDRHIRSVHIKPEFEVVNRCPECLKTFSNRQNLKRHLKIKHAKTDVFTCDVCKADFRKKHLLSSHMYRHTFIKSFRCNFCSKEFISLLEKKKHLKYHRTYNCTLCDTSFNQWSKYQKHRKLVHNSKEYHCNECGRKFKSRRHILQHVKTHMMVKPKVYKCWYEDCERVYSRHSNLKQHIEMKHLQITCTKCEVCDTVLSSKTSLKKHLKTHCKSEKPRKHPKTKETGRKDRKDKGASRFSTALRIAGLLFEPESKKTKMYDEKTENRPVNNLLDEDVTKTKITDKEENSIKNKVKIGPCEKMKSETACETLIMSMEPIHEMDLMKIPLGTGSDRKNTHTHESDETTVKTTINPLPTQDIENIGSIGHVVKIMS